MPNDVLSAALAELTAGHDLTQEDARAGLLEMGGRTGEAQTAAFLSVLRVKGETAAEIVGMARAMSELAEKVDVDADVILGTFSISTAAARAAVASGSARATLDALVATTRRLAQESA